MPDLVTAAYQGFKLMLLDQTGLSRDALHIHFGLAILLAVRSLWRGRWRWLAAWAAAFAFALLGEALDWRGEHLRGAEVPLSAHWHDIWNTMLWPSLIALLGWRIERRQPSGEHTEQPLEQA